MNALTVHHVVSLTPSHGLPNWDSLGSSLIFNQWIPEGRAHGIRTSAAGLETCLWIDRSCVAPMIGEPVTDELLSRWQNITVPRVLVDVRVDGVTDDLVAFIRENPMWKDLPLESTDSVRQALAEQYHSLGLRVLQEVEHAVGRLVSWAYTERRHFWLTPRTDLTKMMGSHRGEWRKTFDIPVELIPEIERRLFQMNIHEQSLFPDMEGLAGLIRQKIRLHWK